LGFRETKNNTNLSISISVTNLFVCLQCVYVANPDASLRVEEVIRRVRRGEKKK
jgi:hypothetical protein